MDLESVSGYEQAWKFQNDPAAGDRNLAVRFYTDEFEDVEASKTAGRPMYKTEECVEIQVPGSRDVKMGRIRYMKPDPRKRFPEAYAKFKSGETVQVVGTPLKAWGLIPAATAKSYSRIGIHTVEQLAGLTDTNAKGIMGAIADRQKARSFLEMAKGLEPAAAARAELEKAQAEIETLRDVVKKQGDKIEALLAIQNGLGVEPPRRRGRPPKAKPEEGQE